jgi:multicomponent Na+:H+ antiporter subunit E
MRKKLSAFVLLYAFWLLVTGQLVQLALPPGLLLWKGGHRAQGMLVGAVAKLLPHVSLALTVIPEPPEAVRANIDPGFLAVGALLALLVVVLTAGKYPRKEWLLSPRRLAHLIAYIPYFLYYCVRANLDVAYRVLHPDLPIRPGIVRVRTELTTNLAKTFLANSITLTPGTLTVDIVGSDVYVHWINVATDDPEKQTEQIVKRFEGFLKRIFE